MTEQVTVPGPVVVRWRETRRWREVVLDRAPETDQERVADAARRMVWAGSPLVEAYQRAQMVVGGSR
jgi:hypothetical protein